MAVLSASDSLGARVAAPGALRIDEVSKHYGGLRAVDGVSAVAQPGQVLGIAGPNGAGKTTLFDVLTGLTPATSGSVTLGETALDDLTVHGRCAVGMARTFQSPTVAGTLTTFENVQVGARMARKGARWTGLGSDIGEDAERWTRWAGLGAVADLPAELLGTFDKKRLMITTALAMAPSALLLDEPFGGLNPEEIDRTIELVRAAADLGVTVVCIEHVMRALVQLATQVIVMQRGRIVFAGTPQEMLADPHVIEVYLGQGASARG